MASSSFKIIHVLVFCAWILIPTSSQSHPHQPEKHAALFIFRDSLYDAGNNNYINTTTDYQVISLDTQLIYFKIVEKLLKQNLGDLYLISIGSNDYLSPFFRNSTLLQSYPQKQNIHMEIYKKGGRKFALINLGPLGCLQDLESKLKGFKYSFSNFYALLEERMNNPSKYGFKEGKIEYAVQVLTEDAQAVGGREE